MARKKKAFNRIPDAELCVMQAVWNAKKDGVDPVRAYDLIESYPEVVDQAKLTTVLTLLTRLTGRGYVSVYKSGRSNMYSPAITEEEYRQMATADFVATVCRKSTANLLSALVEGGLADENTPDELRALLKKDAE